MYNLHSIPPNIWFIFAFHLVLFHKYNRFRTQYYNPTRKAGLKKEYETLFYQYHRMIHSCLLESKKQKESIPSCYSSKNKSKSPALLIIQPPKLANSIQSLHKPFQVRK